MFGSSTSRFASADPSTLPTWQISWKPPPVLVKGKQMPVKTFKTFDAPSRRKWANWLRNHHESESEIWLVFHKRPTSQISISYEDAVEEALCYGWIDSLVKRLDDDCYARKFTPRKPDSKWSTINRRRYANLKARGLLTKSGLERAPTGRNGDAPRPSLSAIPSYIENQLKAEVRAWENFERLAPSYRKAYIGWIDSAKRKETKQKRLREAIRLLVAGQKLGLK
jgi:uncharacterized protein YdeI (YjbR/CyaY-like superfamily)